jgi:chromosome partitioning protein
MTQIGSRHASGAKTKRAHIVVVGNEKGGTGKSTTTVHLITGLLHAGFQVGCLDMDVGQETLNRFLDNRRRARDAGDTALKMPEAETLNVSALDSVEAANKANRTMVDAALDRLHSANDFIVIDTPGSANALSRYGHSLADTLVTPLNDSFVDLDLLATVDPETFAVVRPSQYAEMVWEQKKERAIRDGGSIDWVVMRNRLSSLESRNNKAVEKAVSALARRIGFRVAPGFRERVIFRELFLNGLTLLDIRSSKGKGRLNMSHVAARQEVRMLLRAIGLVESPANVTGQERRVQSDVKRDKIPTD